MSVALAQAPTESAASLHLSCADCLRRHPSLSRAKLYRLVVGGEVRVTLPPGKSPRYDVEDLDRAMRERGA
jgi:hypothetical protein